MCVVPRPPAEGTKRPSHEHGASSGRHGSRGAVRLMITPHVEEVVPVDVAGVDLVRQGLPQPRVRRQIGGIERFTVGDGGEVRLPLRPRVVAQFEQIIQGQIGEVHNVSLSAAPVMLLKNRPATAVMTATHRVGGQFGRLCWASGISGAGAALATPTGAAPVCPRPPAPVRMSTPPPGASDGGVVGKCCARGPQPSRYAVTNKGHLTTTGARPHCWCPPGDSDASALGPWKLAKATMKSRGSLSRLPGGHCPTDGVTGPTRAGVACGKGQEERASVG